MSRRRFTRTGAAALAAGLAGCSAVADSEPTAPASLDAWPPESDGSPLVTRTYYPGWMEWASEAFTRAEVEPLGEPFAWQIQRPFGDGPVGQVRRWIYRLLHGSSSYTGPRREIDLVSVQDYRLESGRDLLHSLPVERMPGWSNVRERFRDVEFYRRDGDTFGIPAEGTLLPLTYDPDTFDRPPGSWELLFDSEYAGEAVWGGSPHDLAKTAAQYTGQDPRDPDDFEAIRAVLEGHYDRLDAARGDGPGSPTDGFFLTAREAVEAFASGEAVLGSLGMSEMYAARFVRGARLEYTAPSEGALFKAFFFGIPTEAPHPMSGLLFLDWALRPDSAVQLVEQGGYMPTVDVSDRVGEEVATFLEWPADWDLRYDDPRTAEETELRYSRMLREVYGLF